MKGIVFNLLEDFVSEGWGDEAYEALLGACPLHTKEPFVGPGTDPDADLVSLLGAACQRFRASPEHALRAFGRFCLPRLAAKSEVATGLLHNLGNALNNIGVSARLLQDRIQRFPLPLLAKISALLSEQSRDPVHSFPATLPIQEPVHV